ncbi:MAG: hypothetical protein V1738_03590 [Patescibacteria group bacterium]
MSNQNFGSANGHFAIVHLEMTANNDQIDSLSALVCDCEDNRLLAFFEARILSNSTVNQDDPRRIPLSKALRRLSDICKNTNLVAFDVGSVQSILQTAYRLTNLQYPFCVGNDVDVRSLAVATVGQVSAGSLGLVEAAERLHIRIYPARTSPLWGSVACWYVLKRIAKI